MDDKKVMLATILMEILLIAIRNLDFYIKPLLFHKVF